MEGFFPAVLAIVLYSKTFRTVLVIRMETHLPKKVSTLFRTKVVYMHSLQAFPLFLIG